MGITGLLPFLKKASRPVNIRDFAGCTVAVDAYCWLHKGAYSCADRLAKGEKTDGYVFYCMKMVNVLLNLGVRPILVFDGCNLPSKAGTETKRREQRLNNKIMGKEFLRQGKIKEARECFQRSIDITPEMALELIKACHKKGVDCIVAPYEADAQLAYLAKKKIVQLVITEDSDLILFGCEKIVFKLDANGNGILIEQPKLSLCFNNNSFTFDKFRHMCIMSGCDYHPSLPGIGLSTAYKFFSKINNPNLDVVLPKIPVYLKKPNLTVLPEYIHGFIRANNTFLYQLVFDPCERKLVPLNPYPPEINPNDLDYAGKYLQNDIAYQVALGNINIKNFKKINNFDPDNPIYTPKASSWNNTPVYSMWSADFSVKKKVSVEVDNHKKERPPPPKTRVKEITVHVHESLRQKLKPLQLVNDSAIDDSSEDQNLTSMYGCTTGIEESTKENDNSFLSENNNNSSITSPLDTSDIFEELERNEISVKRDTEKNNNTDSFTKKLSVTPQNRKLHINRFCITEPTNNKKVRSRFFSSSQPEVKRKRLTGNRALDYFEKLGEENSSSQKLNNSNCLDYFGYGLPANSSSSPTSKDVSKIISDDVLENKNKLEESTYSETTEEQCNSPSIRTVKNSNCNIFQWKNLDTLFSYKKGDSCQSKQNEPESGATDLNNSSSSGIDSTITVIEDSLPESDENLNNSQLDNSINEVDVCSQISTESGLGSSPCVSLDQSSDPPIDETQQLNSPTWKISTCGLKRKCSSTPEIKKGNNTKARRYRPSGLFKKKSQKQHKNENNTRQLSLQESLAKFKFNRTSPRSEQNDVLTVLDNLPKYPASVSISQ